jgi:trans-aconitate methyltransferase
MHIASEQHQEDRSVIINPCNMTMNQARHSAINRILRDKDIERVIDLGCSTGELVTIFERSSAFKFIAGLDCD